MTVRTFVALTALLPAFLFAACNGDDDDATPTTSASQTAAVNGTTVASPTSEGTATPEAGTTPGVFSGTKNPVTATPPAGLQQALLRTIRSAAQPGFDRLVFEFDGAQLPGYSVKYDTKAISCGSGEDVTQFVGEGQTPTALLLVDIRPAAAHDNSGSPTALRDLHSDLSTLKRAFRVCDFEGVVQYAVALNAEMPFKVSTLTNPTRLVIDIGQ
ncbi:MAG: hypothetical protein ABI577_14730 [bacterium]